MEYYVKKIDNFFNLLSNNLYNEYSKNKILNNEVQKYRQALDLKILKFMKKSDSMILNSIEKMYNLCDGLYVQKKTNIPQYYGGYFGKLPSYKNTPFFKEDYKYCIGLKKYKHNLYNALRGFIAKLKFYFSDQIFLEIENEVISKLENESNYTSDGLMDFMTFKNKFITNYGPIVDIRNIEKIKTSSKGSLKVFTYTFELTLKNQERINFLCTVDILCDDTLKIDSLDFECLNIL